ncbi:(2Fe-2S)-binding protein [Oceanibium sediminis]|uniref:(2Fe-2S)-binding protein n=1 Tax=Oceanibium sediminis TaxID=2026339 RepID=UPI000DD35491|nr:(2Fe-2S)-binding protein [Oceanibium sediminis]
MIRLIPDQSRRIRRTAEVTFWFDDAQIPAHEGEPVATALLRAGQLRLRDAPTVAEGASAARGLFCCMGACQECAVEVDGAVVEACRLEAVEGLRVRSLGRGA